MKPLIVTGYTPDYKAYADTLASTASALGETVIRIAYDNRGSWMQNIRGKASCLWDVREAEPDRPLMWVDADSVMTSQLRADDYDLWYEKYDFIGPLVRYKRPRKYYVGCVWFNNTIAGDALLATWMELCEADKDDTGQSDEHWLEYARLKLDKTVRWGELPIEYAWLPRDKEPTHKTVFQMGISGLAGKYAPPCRPIMRVDQTEGRDP